MMYEPVTIGVINYNGGQFIRKCLSSLLNLDYPIYKVILVDNKSTDESLKIVKQEFPEIEVIQLDRNRGHPAARNIILNKAYTRLVLLTDNDVVFENNCLRLLVDTITAFPGIVACGPTVMHYANPTIAQFGPIKYHYIGAAINEISPNEKPMEVDSIGGACILVDKQKVLKTNLYDEDFFFGWVDGDFCLRQIVSGYKCFHVPRAIIYHRDKLRGFSKVFQQIRNRWFLILKIYHWKTLLFISPALFFYELFLAVFLCLGGNASEYIRGIMAVPQDFNNILKKRRKVQALRKVSDSNVLHSGRIMVKEGIINQTSIRTAFELLNLFFNAYWKIIKIFI